MMNMMRVVVILTILLSPYIYASEEEVAALKVLYASTGGSSWYLNTNWLDGNPCTSSWFGVKACDCSSGTCRVTSLVLPSNNLIGSISSISWTNLTYLSLLNMTGNSLTGTVPSELADISSMEVLDLSTNKLSGGLPENLIVGASAKWVHIDLSRNLLSGQLPDAFHQTDNYTVNLACNRFNCPVPGASKQSSIRECVCAAGTEVVDATTGKCGVCSDGTRSGKIFFSLQTSNSSCGTDTSIYNAPFTLSANGQVQHTETGLKQCLTCFTRSKCVAGACTVGANGTFCDQCEREPRTFRLQGSCMRCQDYVVPWGAVAWAVFVFIVILCIYIVGPTASLITKIKQLLHFIQFTLLVGSIRLANWPTHFMHTLNILKFSYFNLDITTLECYTGEYYFYYNWLVTVAIPVIIWISYTLFDRYFIRWRIKKDIHVETDEEAESTILWKKKRTIMRRIVFLFMVIMYAPIASLCVLTFVCHDTVKMDDYEDAGNFFIYDRRLNCNQDLFQVVNFISAIVLVFFSILGPLAISFLVLRLRKWHLLTAKCQLHGATYESFRHRWAFLEPIIMLRKLVIILVIDAAPVSALVHALLQVGTTFCYLTLCVLARPYRSSLWLKPFSGESPSRFDIHNIFEISASVSLFLIQIFALVLVILASNVGESLLNGIDMCMTILTCFTVGLGCVILLCSLWFDRPAVILEENIDDSAVPVCAPTLNDEGEFNEKRGGITSLFNKARVVPFILRNKEKRQEALNF